jgi:hypothetical protein
MAQAPDPGAGARGAGAPRQNKTVKQFGGMNTREGRQAVPDGSFPWLENIQPIGPGNLHSIPGRGQSLTRIPPVPVPPGCIDATLRGQQHLVEELRFLNPDDHGGNTRTSWGYISPTEEVYTLVGDASCGGGNMTYTDLCCQINHFLGPGNPVDHPALVSPDGFPAVNCIVGVSDEPIYTFANSAYRRVFFPASNLAVDLESPSPPFGNINAFAKRGSNFYGLNCTFGGGDGTPRRIWAWDLPGGNFLYESDVILDYLTLNAACTDDFLYALVARVAGVSTPIKGIAKINRSDGSLVSILDLYDISGQVLFVVNDNLIYVLTATGGFYYVENFVDVIYVGSFVSSIVSFSGTGFFTESRFYYGGTGFGGFSAQIYSLPVPCPEGDPIIASVTTDATVAAGADLTVDWADVLEPTIGDQLYLKADDGTLFDPSPLASATPGTGLGSGTFEFPIPGGTTPGSYVIQYVWSNTNLVATSAPFTVT